MSEGKVEAKKVGNTWIIDKKQQNPGQSKKKNNEENK